jgi:hypothetical protein
MFFTSALRERSSAHLTRFATEPLATGRCQYIASPMATITAVATTGMATQMTNVSL